MYAVIDFVGVDAALKSICPIVWPDAYIPRFTHSSCDAGAYVARKLDWPSTYGNNIVASVPSFQELTGISRGYNVSLAPAIGYE